MSSLYKSFSVCSHTVAIAFKLNIFPWYIKKAEQRNSNQALTNAVNFGEKKYMQVKKISVDLQRADKQQR